MKLYIKRKFLKFFATNHMLPITDETGNEKYYILRDKRKKVGYNYVVYDSALKELAYTRQVRYLTPQLEIYVNDLLYTKVTRKLSYPYTLFNFEGSDLKVKGDCSRGHEYIIKRGLNVVAFVETEGMDIEIDIVQSKDAGLIIVLAWTIDYFATENG